MKKHRNIILTSILLLLSFVYGYGQNLIQNDKFIYVTTFKNKVVFLKEIPISNKNMDYNYFVLKEWGKKNYSNDITQSNIRYDNKNKEILVKSRVELILPENSEGLRESVLMIYHLNAFILDNKCILEVKNITYNSPERTTIRSFKAEDIISDEAIRINDDLGEFRVNTKKSTLYFLNELANELADVFNKEN